MRKFGKKNNAILKWTPGERGDEEETMKQV